MIPRRRFLLATGSLLVAAHRPQAALHAASVARQTHRAFGTEVSIAVVHPDQAVADGAIASAFDELERIERVMSLYRPESELSRLNQTGVLPQPDRYLVEVLRACARLSSMSHGAFDATVQPLWEVYATAHRQGRLPTEEEVEQAKRRVDWRRVSVDAHHVRLGQGTQVTLNGIAQGFAVDRARTALRRHEVEHALIDFGELGALGRAEGGRPWNAGIQHPRESDAFIALPQLDDRCLATSGDYATTFSDDFSRNHLFDPRSGTSPTELASVTVAAQTGLEADALSTTVAVAGLDAGLALLEHFPKADLLAVLKTGRVMATKGMKLEKRGTE